MNIKQAFFLAVKSLMANKMRAGLTMLGVIIGVSSVITLVSMMGGMKGEFLETFTGMGTNRITVTITGNGTKKVTINQLEALVDNNPEYLTGVSPTINVSNATAKYKNINSATSVIGVSEDYCVINNLSISEGASISYIDIKDRQKVCLVGTYIVDHFYAGDNPIGDSIKINGTSFMIIGILDEKSESEKGSADDQILIPYTVAQKLAHSNEITNVSFNAVDAEASKKAKQVIQNFLYGIYGDPDAYSVMCMAEAIEEMSEVLDLMTVVLIGIAAISLLVGGIGIMNIMLISVTERTREIGIRKALGATPWDIMSQFVVEAITTSSVGGAIGVLEGIVMSHFSSKLLEMKSSMSLEAIAIAFVVCVSIGIIFGYIPARKAAELEPIDALRFE